MPTGHIIKRVLRARFGERHLIKQPASTFRHDDRKRKSKKKKKFNHLFLGSASNLTIISLRDSIQTLVFRPARKAGGWLQALSAVLAAAVGGWPSASVGADQISDK